MRVFTELVRAGDEDQGRFARELAEASRPQAVYELIVRTMARAVGAGQGVLAVYDDDQACLVIAATHGDPMSLVETLRIQPGSGVVGRAFASRRCSLMAGISRRKPEGRRLRARRPSTIAVPLLAAGEALGVVSLTDRSDGRPFDAQDLALVRALTAPAALALATVRLVEQKRRLEHALATDPLTGLFNRRYFDARLEEEIGRAARSATSVALLAIDVDRFKSLNDTWGHAVGDAVLRAVADVLRRSTRVFDVCARVGGDEFAVLLPATDGVSGAHTAERIRTQVETSTPQAISHEPGVTISIGLAVLDPGGTTTASASHEVLVRADRALYLAKAGGRNCLRSFGDARGECGDL